jgi:hypothetical protein
MHINIYEPRKTKTTYNLERREYKIVGDTLCLESYYEAEGTTFGALSFLLAFFLFIA